MKGVFRLLHAAALDARPRRTAAAGSALDRHRRRFGRGRRAAFLAQLEVEAEEFRVERLLVRLLAFLGERDEAQPAPIAAQGLETRVHQHPLEVVETVRQREAERLEAAVEVEPQRGATGGAIGGARRESGARRLGGGPPEGDLALLVAAGEEGGDRFAEARRELFRAERRRGGAAERQTERQWHGPGEERADSRSNAHASSAEGPYSPGTGTSSRRR